MLRELLAPNMDSMICSGFLCKGGKSKEYKTLVCIKILKTSQIKISRKHEEDNLSN